MRPLVADNPPFVLDVDTGAITPVAGVDTRGRPVLSVQAAGRDAVFWLQRSSGRDTAGQTYVLRRGSTRARRIATGSEVAPAQLWAVAGDDALAAGRDSGPPLVLDRSALRQAPAMAKHDPL